ncbi:MAG: DUF3011 domain-containing protein [Acidobacteriaceae bacterium]
MPKRQGGVMARAGEGRNTKVPLAAPEFTATWVRRGLGLRAYAVLVLSLGLLAALPAAAQTIVTCSSDNGGRKYCAADTSRGVTLGKQRSGAACQQGSTWGYDNRGIWVDRGCRADFIVGGKGNSWSGNGNGTPQTITCSSDGGRKYCPANTTGGVQLTRQRSNARCTQGSTWGYDNQGIWVDKGCRADFAAYARQGGISGVLPWNKGNGNGGAQGVITCSSNNGSRQYCPAQVSRGGVRLAQQLSGSPCVQGSTWGYDNGGIWVDKGCRASFQIR